jgi:hypothetical protein
MTPNGDAVLHLKDEAHGAADFLCRWRAALAVEPGGHSTHEGFALFGRQQRGSAVNVVKLFSAALHVNVTTKAPAAPVAPNLSAVPPAPEGRGHTDSTLC